MKECNCIKDVEVKLLEHIKGLKPELTITGNFNMSDNTGIQEKVLYMNGGVQIGLTFAYMVSSIKKDGTPTKPVKKKMGVSINFCPFCGTKLK